MSNRNAKSNRGGQREGSGRKKVLINPVNKLIRVEQSMVDRIEELGYNISEFLREAGEEKLKRISEQNDIT